MTTEESTLPEIYAIAFLEDQIINVYDKAGIEKLQNTGYFGTMETDSRLKLDPEEALLLLERGRLQICVREKNNTTECKEIQITDFVKKFSANNAYFYKNYLIYKDLRNRGYVCKTGFGRTSPYRLYPRGTSPQNIKEAKQIIFPFIESHRPLPIDELDFIVTQARRLRKQLILGVVDRHGDVTYYEAEQMELLENQYKADIKDFHRNDESWTA